jgi:hypothetical protein
MAFGLWSALSRRRLPVSLTFLTRTKHSHVEQDRLRNAASVFPQ